MKKNNGMNYCIVYRNFDACEYQLNMSSKPFYVVARPTDLAIDPNYDVSCRKVNGFRGVKNTSFGKDFLKPLDHFLISNFNNEEEFYEFTGLNPENKKLSIACVSDKGWVSLLEPQFGNDLLLERSIDGDDDLCFDFDFSRGFCKLIAENREFYDFLVSRRTTENNPVNLEVDILRYLTNGDVDYETVSRGIFPWTTAKSVSTKIEKKLCLYPNYRQNFLALQDYGKKKSLQ